MSLKSIVRALGGDLYDRGRRANIPAPGHSRRDRSVSLLQDRDRIIIHTFGDGDWRAVRDHLRGLGLLGGEPRSAPAGPAERRGRDDGRQRRAVASQLWASGRDLVRTLSERHCRQRGAEGPLPGPHVLRHADRVPLSVYRPGGAAAPALLAAISDADGALTAVEITYLGAGGRRAVGLNLSRKTVGFLPPGSAVRLDAIAPEMLVAEGVFTTLAARRRFGLPAWALLSTSNLRSWRPPPGVGSVVIAADRGPDGEASARTLAKALQALGIRTRIALPPPPHGDWNEAEAAVQLGGGGAGREKEE